MEQQESGAAPQSGHLPAQTLARMPYYLEYLKQLEAQGVPAVSSPTIARHFGFSEVQVRKDLAAVSPVQGRPKMGFPVSQLILCMEEELGYHRADSAVLVGAGQLGRALISYGDMVNHGIRFVAAFDVSPALVGRQVNGIPVRHTEELTDFCRREGIRAACVAVPAAPAQSVCDQLVRGGVIAIWNFAPTSLQHPPEVLIRNENMLASLAMLSRHLMLHPPD
ncbi:MAG: redox-sensing transcriptional repressor Rex [Oscillospiraceae bacterium]|nr:redox-sensing transcriptional repressor Rex [Oscillospiraceae bacterium]